MKALTIRQPFALGIAAGAKTVEVRSRATSIRGEILICAGKTPTGFSPKEDIDLGIVYGQAIGVATLVDCQPFDFQKHLEASCLDPEYFESGKQYYAWIFGNAYEIEPFPVTGKLGFFEVATA